MTVPNAESEARYHEYWEEMPCFLSVHDRDFRIVDGNRRFREHFGERIGEYCFRVYKGREEICPTVRWKLPSRMDAITLQNNC